MQRIIEESKNIRKILFVSVKVLLKPIVRTLNEKLALKEGCKGIDFKRFLFE